MNIIKRGLKMISKELEEMAGIKEEDKSDCPYVGEDLTCDDCRMGLVPETCEDLYEQYLLEKIKQ